MMSFRLLIYFSIGVASGFMSGMFGIGAGSVRIPLLNSVGLPLLSAYGINLFVIPFSSAVGAFNQRQNIKYRIATYMALGGIIGSVAGALFTGLIPTLTLAILFVTITLMSVAGMYFDRLSSKVASMVKATPHNIIFGTMVLNMITGVRGGSGGSLFPSFLKILGFDIHDAIATSLFVTIFTALAGLIIYWHRGDVDLLPALTVLAGSIIGASYGSKLSLRTKPAWLEVGVSILISLFALMVLFRSVK